MARRARPVLPAAEGVSHQQYGAACRRYFSWRQDGFSVQCGAYQQRKGAEDEARRLTAAFRASGLKAAHRLDWRGGQAVYVVRIGLFPTYAEAVRELANVRRQVPDAFIVP